MHFCTPCCSKDDDRPVGGIPGTEEYEPVTGAQREEEENREALQRSGLKATPEKSPKAPDASASGDRRAGHYEFRHTPDTPDSPASSEPAAARLSAKAASPEQPSPRRPPLEREAPRAPTRFTAKLRKDSAVKSLQAHFDFCDGEVLLMTSISRGGAVYTYNLSCPPERRLRPGDYIISVNDATGDSAEMVAELEKSSELLLVVKRPMEFEVEVSKLGGALGLDISYAEEGFSLLIAGIMPGLVTAWGEANPGKEVQPGDRIVEVGGTAGGPERLLECIKGTEDALRLKFARPHPD